MTWQLVLPMTLALVAAAATRPVQTRLRPRLSAYVLTAITALCALAVLWATAAIAFGYLVEVRWLAETLGWCRDLFRTHDRVSPPVGLAASVALPIMVLRGVRTRRRQRAALRGPRPEGGIDILACEEPIAYAVPGRPGHVVVSTGMLSRLEPEERAVLFAHEQAHLDHRHDRFVAIAGTAVGAVPFLRPLLGQVRYATERWADEVAAERVGDRRLVARAIARAALAGFDGAGPNLALARLGVPGRVEALLEDPRERRVWAGLALAAGLLALLASLGASSVQLHHLVGYALHVCGL